MSNAKDRRRRSQRPKRGGRRRGASSVGSRRSVFESGTPQHPYLEIFGGVKDFGVQGAPDSFDEDTLL